MKLISHKKFNCYFKNFFDPSLVGIQTAKDRRWLKKKNIAHFNRYLQAFEHASFDSFVVAVSEVMACHVNFDFSVCGQGYFHRKITIVFKFSRCFYSVFVVILVETNEKFWPSLESAEHFVVGCGNS